MLCFFGKIFFVRKFIPDFAETIRPLQLMIKKNTQFKWSWKGKEAFEKIKSAISNALVLCSPYFNKVFYLYTFAYDLSIAVVLTQKNEDDQDQPISFMNTNVHENQLKYQAIEKQSYVVFRVVKHFRPFILKNHAKVIDLDSVLRSLFVQQ